MARIFVGNLNFGVRDGDLSSAFSTFGKVHSAAVPVDSHTLRPQGFGFVEMPDSEEARTAAEALDGAELRGRPLSVRVILD
jgi:RNA recognition motif-containing protein